LHTVQFFNARPCKEGQKALLPFLLPARESRLRDRRSQRGRGDEYMLFARILFVLLFIPDSQYQLNYYAFITLF
jgi:hypothetical protein